MKVVIAGAGNVGRSIASELVGNGHEVVVVEREERAFKVQSVPDATWLLADACEVSTLETANLQDAQVMVAATGDDKVNLVVSLLAKTEFGVQRVVARVNHPKNEWLFSDAWGVDVAVSTPRLLSALVEEAVSVGDLVRLLKFQQSDTNLVEVTLPGETPLAGQRVASVPWPPDSALVAILRDQRVLVPSRDDPLEGGDELLIVVTPDQEEALREALAGASATSVGTTRAPTGGTVADAADPGSAGSGGDELVARVEDDPPPVTG